MDDSKLRELCDLNLLESIRFHGRLSPSATLQEEGGVLLVAGSSEFPVGYSNAATRVDPGVAPAEVVERADAFFRARGRSYTVWVRGGHDADLADGLLDAGAAQVIDSPCMSIDGPLGWEEPSGEIRVRIAETADEVQDALAVNRAAYQSIGMPPHETDVVYQRPEAWLGPEALVAVAYLNDEPMATASLLMSPQVGGLYWVGTREEGRGRGLGELCTRVTTDAAFERGAQVATLQASVMGEPIYRRLGYREIDRQRWFLRNPA